jgi:hypothetical protein
MIVPPTPILVETSGYRQLTADQCFIFGGRL